MTHTKGKWTARPAIDSNGKTLYYEICIKGQHFATVIDNEYIHDGLTLEEAKANAKLIATAPELLEALKESNETLILDTKSNPNREDWVQEVIQRNSELIKKAES